MIFLQGGPKFEVTPLVVTYLFHGRLPAKLTPPPCPRCFG